MVKCGPTKLKCSLEVDQSRQGRGAELIMNMCTACGAEIRSGERFCRKCGSAVDTSVDTEIPPTGPGAPMSPTDERTTTPPLDAPASPTSTCPSCGSEVNPGQRFCRKCGSAVAATDSSLATAGVAAPATRAIARSGPLSSSSQAPPQAIQGDPVVIYQPKSRKGKGVSGLTIAIGVILLLILGGAAFFITHSLVATTPTVALTPVVRPTSPTSTSTTRVTPTTRAPSSTALAQATAINGVVTQSAAARSNLGSAITAIESCGDIQSAITSLQSDASSRSALAQNAETFQLSGIPNGAELRSDLVTALQASASSDQSYALWGNGLLASGGCQGTAPQDSNWTAAQASDTQATAAKTAFVTVWTPVAQQFGFTILQPNQF